jgi:hypothetical protein
MTDDLSQEIMSKGMKATLIDNILGYAEAYQQANVMQESLKALRKTSRWRCLKRSMPSTMKS